MKRWLKYSLLSILLLLLTITAGLAWLISTESGLHFIVARAQQFSPGTLKIETLQGTLLDEISLTGFSYQYEKTHVQVNTFTFHWDSDALWDKKLHVTQLHIDGITLDLPESEEVPPPKEETPLSIPDIQLPIQISIDDVRINNITINTAGAEPFIIDSIALQTSTSSLLSIQHLQIKSPLFNAKLAGDIGLITPHNINLDLDWSVPLPDFIAAGHGKLHGDTQKLVLNHTLDAPLAVTLNTAVFDVLGTLKIEADVSWKTLHWPLHAKNHLINSQNGQVTFLGTLDNYQIGVHTKISGTDVPTGDWNIAAQGNQQEMTLTKLNAKILKGHINATGQVSWTPTVVAHLDLSTSNLVLQELWQDWPKQLKLNTQLQATLDGNDVRIKQFKINLPRTKTALSLQAQATLAGEQTRFKTTVTWKGVQWPLVDKKPLVHSKKGTLDLSGTAQNYQISLNTRIAGADIPKSTIVLKGNGDLQQFTLKSLKTKLLKGVVNATGKMSWHPKLVGVINLKSSQINLQELWKDWPQHLKINSQLQATLDGNDIHIKQLKISLPPTKTSVSLQADGTLAGEKTRFKTTLSWKGVQWPLMGKKALVKSKNGQLKLSGTPQNYHMSLKTKIAGTDIPKSTIALKGQGDLKQFTLTSLKTHILKGVINATGNVSWQPKLKGTLTLNSSKISLQELWKDWPKHLNIKSQLVAQLDGQKIKIKKLEVRIPQTDAKLSLHGDLSEQYFDTTLKWQGVQWPLVGKIALVNSQKGTLNVKGTPKAYELDLNTQITGQDIPKGRWIAKGQGTPSEFTLDSLKGDILQGALNLKGHVQWLPYISWDIALNGKKLNPGTQWKEWPGKIALDIKSGGKFKDGKLDTTVSINKIQGKLRQYPLKVSSQIAIKDDNYHIKKFHFRSGKTHVTAQGLLGQQSKLQWKIKAPNLTSLLPDAKGHLTAQGSVQGVLYKPHIQATLKGKGLAFQNNTVNTVALDLNINVETQKDLYLKLVATDLKQDTTEIKQLSLLAKGSVVNHRIDAKVTLPEDSLSLKLKGGLQEAQWQGSLQKLIAATAQAGKWSLQKPVPLSLSATEVSVNQLCLKNTNKAKFCTQAKWKKTADATILSTLENFSLDIINAFLPDKSDLTGMINARIKTTLHPDGGVLSAVQIKLSKGTFKTYLEDEDDISEFHYKGGHIDLNITQNGLAAELDLNMLDHSSIKGTFSLPRLTHIPPRGEQPMKGKLAITFSDLGILPGFIPDIEKPTGHVNVDIAVGGSLTAPIVEGKIQVHDASVKIPLAGLTLKKINVILCSTERELLDWKGTKSIMACSKEPNTLQLKVTAVSGEEEGHLEIDGIAHIRSLEDWNGHLNIVGKDFEVVSTPDAWALISPNLKISIDPNNITATGEILIPEVAITPVSSGSGAIAVSEDVVIVNPIVPIEQENTVPQDISISSKVKIILGDNVTFDGSGFKSSFGGTLIASNEPGKMTVGNGELYIIGGHYKAFGQNLKIDRGRVFFTGGAIENPGLSIPAYRRIKTQGSNSSSDFNAQSDTGNVIRSPISRNSDNEVIVGVLITGTVKSPQITFFSDPLLDQSNILSYLVLGKPVARATESEGELLFNTLTSLSIKGGDSLSKKIGDTFGLDDVGISSDDNVEESALVIGKYLTPDLYISYGYGIFDGSNILRMRYELTKKLTLETETGVQSGVDLRYTFELD